MVKIVENQYKDKINSMHESHNALIKELSDKNKALQTNYNHLFEKHEIISREKDKDVNSSEKKIQDLSTSEKKLREQIDNLKSERDKKMIDHQQVLEKERETYKTKLHDAESKAREADQKRNSLIFEFEKEKAKWALKRDHL
jgi:hypothetical protein